MRLAFLALFALWAGCAHAAEFDDLVSPTGCAGNKEPVFCEQYLATLRKEYPQALRGDYQAQRNVSYCLTTSCDGALKINRPLGCAWRAVILGGNRKADNTDVDSFNTYCRGKLTGGDVLLFANHLDTLFRRIYKRPAPAL